MQREKLTAEGELAERWEVDEAPLAADGLAPQPAASRTMAAKATLTATPPAVLRNGRGDRRMTAVPFMRQVIRPPG
ncbi:MAG: hypothetical protein J2P58_06395 [Acidimicrobiaceae bacterium]|nr:hypothetical protein [Acidimicrobiaceae bacterium]MBO0747673.1 hypothetical protein [Acidimicrobiaceae bacterium]